MSTESVSEYKLLRGNSKGRATVFVTCVRGSQKHLVGHRVKPGTGRDGPLSNAAGMALLFDIIIWDGIAT